MGFLVANDADGGFISLMLTLKSLFMIHGLNLVRPGMMVVIRQWLWPSNVMTMVQY